MKSIKGTKTEQNLLKSFAGESQARGRYVYFASIAKKEGYEQISAIFSETAKRFFKFLEGGMVEITASSPAGIPSTTLENLKAAAAGENEEWSELYPEFAKVADEEGFPEIAEAWRRIATVEAGHEARYLKLYERVLNGTVFEDEEEIEWQCRNCGYIHKREKGSRHVPGLPTPESLFRAQKEQLLSREGYIKNPIPRNREGEPLRYLCHDKVKKRLFAATRGITATAIIPLSSYSDFLPQVLSRHF